MGLTISKKLVEIMHGEISFTSVPNQGSCFSIELPKCEPPLNMDQEGIPAVAPIDGTEKIPDPQFIILYIEDNPMNLSLVERILKQRTDIKLLSAPRAKLGLELARSHRPDLILMDINLPGMNGLEALEYLKIQEETCGIPVVALSANVMQQDMDKAKKVGFYEYLTKPVNIDRFFEVLNKILK